MNLKGLVKTAVLSTIAIALLGGCPNTGDPVGDEISPVWTVGEEFHVKSIYRIMHVKNDEFSEANNLLEEWLPGFNPMDAPQDESWTTPVVWRFAVVQSQWLPDASSIFYPFAADKSGAPAELTILQALAPKELNPNPVAYQLDPVFFIVIREVDLKVMAVSFNYLSSGGDRLTRTVEFDDTFNREAAADTPVFILPYLMPAFPLRIGTYTDTINGGDPMYVTADGSTAVDVSFTASLDKSIVDQGWEAGQPWFTYSYTANMRAWLMDELEVMMLEDEVGTSGSVTTAISSNPTTLEDAFSRRIDLNAEIRIEAGTIVGRAAPGYIPWGGAWWPQRGGKLVFGWNNQSTPSTEVRAMIDPTLAEVETLGDWLRNNDRSDPEWSTKYEEYQTKRTEVRNTLDTFYTNLKNEVVSGTRSLADVNNWSPFDKTAVYLLGLGRGGSNPFNISKWELSNHYTPTGASWWGHCNGWAAAAILTNEPREDATFTVPNPAGGADLNITFDHADLKGLSTESHYSTLSLFYGERYNGEEQDINDLSPVAFHNLLTYYVKGEGFPFVFDITAGDEVWNYPVYEFNMDVTLSRDLDAGTISLNTATRDELELLPRIGETIAKRIVNERSSGGPFESMDDFARRVDGVGEGVVAGLAGVASVNGHRVEYDVTAFVKFADDAVGDEHLDASPSDPETLTRTWRYTLIARPDGVVVEGTWENPSEHPDFAWVPYSNSEYYSRSENAHLKWTDIKTMFSVREYAPTGCSSDSDCAAGETCDPFTRACVGGAPPPPPPGGDVYEPNNSMSEAAALGNGSYSDLDIAEGGDEDWFAIAVDAGGTLEVIIAFAHANGDLDAKLLSASGDTLASSTSVSDSETLTTTSATGGTFYVRVYGYSGATNSYTMTVTGAAGGMPPPPPPPVDPTNEPNESAAAANPVVTGSWMGLSISSASDEDWFVATVSSGSVSATINFSNAVGDLDMELLDSGSNVIDSSTTTGDTEMVSGSGLAAGMYFIRVFGYSGATGDYSLSVTVD